MKYCIGVIVIGVCLMVSSACTQQPNPCLGIGTLALTFFPVYPVLHATSVPDSPQSVVFERSPSVVKVSGIQLVLTPGSGPSIVANPGPVPSPLPTPNASPSPGAILVAFSVPTLAAATTYQLGFNGTETLTGSCPGPWPIAGYGVFTTQ